MIPAGSAITSDGISKSSEDISCFGVSCINKSYFGSNLGSDFGSALGSAFGF